MLVFSHTPDCFFLPCTLQTVFAPPDRALARAVKESGLEVTGPNAGGLRRVAAVGAAYHPAFGFSSNTRQLLSGALAAAAQHGYAPAPDVRFAPVNLHFGLDALCPEASGLQADLFVSCFVYHPAHAAQSGACVHAQQTTSPLHHKPGIWARAARAMGAKIIVVCSLEESGDELRASAFAGGDYNHLATHISPISFEDTPMRLMREVLVRKAPALPPAAPQ